MEIKKPENSRRSSGLTKFYHKLLYLPLALVLFGFSWGVFCYFRTQPYPLDGGRLNFLVLGASGGDHAGKDLTDTMMMISLDFERNKIFLISIPRDFWHKPLKIKVNAAYYYGGFPLVNSLVWEITGMRPAFSFLLDFRGFVEMIDLAGGVEIEVLRSFDDYKYPREDEEGKPATKGDIYEHIRFEKGKQVMDGERALKYSRSRNSEDENEGTDEARSFRQQQVLLALKDKVMSLGFLLDISRVRKMVGIAGGYMETDFPREKISSLLKTGIGILKIRDAVGVNLGDEAQQKGIIFSPPLTKYGQWVLEPKAGDWQEVRDLIARVLENGQSN